MAGDDKICYQARNMRDDEILCEVEAGAKRTWIYTTLTESEKKPWDKAQKACSYGSFGSVFDADEILMEVLARLPVDSLMRFKCVCKRWFSLITEPFFVDLFHSVSSIRCRGGLFLLRNPPYLCLGGCYHTLNPNKETLDDRLTIHEPSPLFSSFSGFAATNMVNGLMCFYDMYCRRETLSIYNFTTREILLLPKLNPSLRRKCYLGLDPTKKKYTVLNVFLQDNDGKVECHVLTVGSKDNTWRPVYTSNISNTLSFLNFRDFELGFYCDGFIYWNLQDVRSNTAGVFAFDVEFETLEFMCYPQELALPSQENITLCQVGGLVSLVQLPWSPYPSDSNIVLWKLMEGKDGHRPMWNKQCITFPFRTSKNRRVTCSDFGLLSMVRGSVPPNAATIDCYYLTSGTSMVLKVNNPEGFFNYGSGNEFRPSILVDNIAPLGKI